MALSRFLKFLVFGTVLSLTYIHLQMRIIDLAYQGNSKEKRLRKLVQENGYIMYSILTLKSANYLGDKLLKDKDGMIFVDPHQIVDVSFQQAGPMDSPDFEIQDKGSIISLLTLTNRAEARTKK